MKPSKLNLKRKRKMNMERTTIDDDMALRCFAAMQKEASTKAPNLTKLAASMRGISATGDADFKSAFIIEMKWRQHFVLGTPAPTFE